MFVAIAVVAAALVATSTFRIVFAQRMRQLALLRAVGAGRGALIRALAAEGALTGLVAGVVGVLARARPRARGAGAGRAFGVQIASPGPAAGRPRCGVVALAVVITVLAVLAPALSAARVSPLEALRHGEHHRRPARHRRGPRWAFGLLLALGAAGARGVRDRASCPSRDPADYNPRCRCCCSSGPARWRSSR